MLCLHIKSEHCSAFLYVCIQVIQVTSYVHIVENVQYIYTIIQRPDGPRVNDERTLHATAISAQSSARGRRIPIHKPLKKLLMHVHKPQQQQSSPLNSKRV